MKARPILFSGPMVRALLDGRKTQTRRIVRPQPFNGASDSEIIEQIGGLLPGRSLSSMVQDAWETGFVDIPCPYGKPDDVLWVRETWRPHDTLSPWDLEVSYAADGATRYIRDGEFGDNDWNMPKAAVRGNVSPLFMPRWASRITLEIESIRVERLQDISEEDAIAEGIDYPTLAGRQPDDLPGLAPSDGFADLWQSINGPESWAANPWVWALTFKPRLVNVDEFLKQREAA